MSPVEPPSACRAEPPRVGLPLALALLVTACDADTGPPAEGVGSGRPSVTNAPAWFREVASEVGVDFRHVSDAGATELRFPEIMGGGVALLDADDDGDLELYFVQSGRLGEGSGEEAGNALFENDGTGHFTDVSVGSGADDQGYGMGVATADVDGDGRVELFVTNLGRNTLLANRGALRFEDTSTRAGITEAVWSTSAAFFDQDRDGDLDLFVCNYVGWSSETELGCMTVAGRPDYCSPNSYNRPLADSLLRNEGDGTFVDVSATAGLRAVRGNGLGVVTGDFDGDGRTDVFVANDQMANRLWHNEGDGTFVDVALALGCGVDQHGSAKAGMGTLAEDFDDDLDLDLLVVNLRAQSDSLFRNEGAWFSDATAKFGLGSVTRPFTRFGVGAPDFDNDGWRDLYEANGRVVIASEISARSADPYAEPNVLLRGGPGGVFRVLEPEGGVSSELVHTSRGAAFGDLDGDGGVDVVVVNRDGPAYVLHNVVPDRGHWLHLRAVDAGGHDVLGAELELTWGGRTVRRDVRTAYGYCAANDARVHVGLGAARSLDEVLVRWPDGEQERFGPFAADREVVLARGSGASR